MGIQQRSLCFFLVFVLVSNLLLVVILRIPKILGLLLRDSHEEVRNFGMSHRYAVGYLNFEAWYHTAVRARHIAETRKYKAHPANFPPRCVIFVQGAGWGSRKELVVSRM